MKGTAMATKIFVNLPVQDLDKSMAFFQALGYQFNPQMTDKTAACLVISEDIQSMLLTHAKFKELALRDVCNVAEGGEVILCLSCDSREQVDTLVQKAIANGGKAHEEPQDYGFMYHYGFQDLDGHLWGLIYINPDHVQKS
jgi:hypothetical protein